MSAGIGLPTSSACRHWRSELLDGVVLLTLDTAGQSANTLSREVLVELDGVLAELEAQRFRGLVLRSGKRAGFIAGADVREFEKIITATEAGELARNAQRVFARFAALPYPTVAMIHGYCLGGGLELALACTWRVARDDAATRLGLPEVHLGVHPGFAGTVRLPPLIGDLPALEMMISGRALDVHAARRLGLVDEIAPERHLLQAAMACLHQPSEPVRVTWYKQLPGWRSIRSALAWWLRRQLVKKLHPGHYPAPFRLLELWRDHAPAEREAQSFGELMVSPEGRNLTGLFLRAEALKRFGRATAHGVEWLHVVGAGTMGTDIAILAVERGFRVSLQDHDPKALVRAMQHVYEYFREHRRDPRAIQEALDRIMPDLAGNGIARADLVVEAIVENADAKRALFRAIEPRLKPQALMASNSSSIPLEDLASALADPGRLVGLHFFYPVGKTQLIEVVHGRQSSEAALARSRAFACALDRLPLNVASRPGFLVNRVLVPYLLEAVRMLEEGIPAPNIDAAMREFGMPMGPIEFADSIGLDICLTIAEKLSSVSHVEVPALLRRQVMQKRLGRKSGGGFYMYTAAGRRRRAWQRAVADPAHAERLILRLLNECMACLREQVVADCNAVDLGLVYGAGFAPFRGGPMRYAASVGQDVLHHNFHRLAARYGVGFSPDSGWNQADLWPPISI